MKNKLESMRDNVTKLRKEIWALERKQWIEQQLPKYKKLVGTYWKYRNSSSCPKEASDYWWLYIQITEISTDGHARGKEVQIDKEGKLTMREERWLPLPMLDGYIRATRREWNAAVKRAQKKLDSYKLEAATNA